MKLLLDQDVYAVTIRFLAEQGHDVLPVAQIGLARADDVDLLKKAKELGRIFVTRDSDFGRLVFMENLGQASCICVCCHQLNMPYTMSLYEF